MMKVVVNTNYTGHSAFICKKQIASKLMKNGWEVVYNDWENYQEYDLVLFVAPDSQVEKAKKVNKKIITGIIDPKVAKKRQIKECKLADFLAVTSLEQKDFFLKYNRNVFVYYHFPEIKETPKKHFKKDKIIIGYHGNKFHLNGMVNLTKALDKLAEKYHIEFWAIYNIKLLGKWKRNLPKKCLVKHIQWSEEIYYTHLSKCDIGVVPMITPINLRLGKLTSRPLSSYLKNWAGYNKEDYLIRFKYSANPGRIYPFSQLYIPVVADFFPSACQMIQDNCSGFLVYSTEGWYKALEKLILSPNLRNEISRNLKNFIDNNCSPGINFRKLLKFIESLRK